MFTRQTYTAKAPSGFEFELKRMKAYHQEWLTEGAVSGRAKGTKKGKNEHKVEDILADILVRIDDDEDITGEKVLQLPRYDFKYMLFIARFFSCDLHFCERMEEWEKFQHKLKLWKIRQSINAGTITDAELIAVEMTREQIMDDPSLDQDNEPEYESILPDHIFKFTFTWEQDDEELTHEYEVPLHMHDFKVVEPKIKFTWKDLTSGRGADSFDAKDMRVKLPISGQELVWHILDIGLEEKNRGGFSIDKVNINTELKWRNPRILSPKESEPGKFMPVQANPSKFEYLDIEEYRKAVFETEGKVDSTLTLRLPETGKLIKVDVLGTTTFFIPSGVL